MEQLLLEPSWVDLIDVGDRDRVLLVGGPDRRAESALLRAGAVVRVVESQAGADALVAALSAGPWDAVCFDGVDLPTLSGTDWLRSLGLHGQLAVVGDHTTSPLRCFDALTRGSGVQRVRQSRRRTLRALGEAGLAVHQVFGLLRSTDAPVVAFDALAASSKDAVLNATVAHVGGWRGRAVRIVSRLSAQRLLAQCPGWVVVARVTPHPEPDRIVGKVSNRDSDEVKVLRGEPVSILERRYLRVGSTAEVLALRELEDVGFALSPRVIGVPTDRSCRFSWLPGESLPLDRLEEEELVTWVGRAARLLGELQRHTRHDDGTVLVHGDFWLGNLLTSEGAITGVVDWTEARRGAPHIDSDFLVASLERWITGDALRARLEHVRDRELGGQRRP